MRGQRIVGRGLARAGAANGAHANGGGEFVPQRDGFFVGDAGAAIADGVIGDAGLHLYIQLRLDRVGWVAQAHELEIVMRAHVFLLGQVDQRLIAVPAFDLAFAATEYLDLAIPMSHAHAVRIRLGLLDARFEGARFDQVALVADGLNRKVHVGEFLETDAEGDRLVGEPA